MSRIDSCRWIPLVAGFLLGCTAAPAFAEQDATVTLHSLLLEMVNREAVVRLPSPAYTCTQYSSHDPAAKSPQEDWFANYDRGHYLRSEERDGRTEWVMVDADGPGAIVRLWSANPKGTLRVYLDGAAEPVLAVPMEDLLGARWRVPAPLSGELGRGWTLYLPIPYAAHVLVTSDQDDFYYQVNVRTYAPDTTVKTLSVGDVEAEAATLEAVCAALLGAGDQEHGAGEVIEQVVPPGGRAGFAVSNGPWCLRQLSVDVTAEDLAAALRTLVLEMECDGERTVWCPVGDFFGSGIGANPVSGWWRTVRPAGDGRSVRLSCRWVMPYERNLRLQLHNLGTGPAEVRVRTLLAPFAWDDRSCHFFATWRQQDPIHTQPRQDWNYLTVEGQGLYLGDTLAVANPVKVWWGEGDEKIYVDGETFPSHFGTGTEDYYSYAWGCPDLFHGPFNAQPRCDGPDNFGHTTVTRVRSLDAIPFSQGLRFDMEVWHWAECDIGYAATAYFYARPGAAHNRPPAPEEAARGPLDPPPLPPPFRVEGALECEDLEILAVSEDTPAGPQQADDGVWSGERQLWVQGRGPGAFVELAVPAEDGVPRRLLLRATVSWDYGILRFFVDGERVGEDVDTFNPEGRKVGATDLLDLGVHTPSQGRFVLRAEVVGGNPRSEGSRSFFGLDCILLRDP